jgi:hypothetical protein
MGTIFEYLIRKFKEPTEAAGRFYTARLIRDVKLTFEPDRQQAKEKLIAIYDPPADGRNAHHRQGAFAGRGESGPDVVSLRAGDQEKTSAVAKADMLMKGEDPETSSARTRTPATCCRASSSTTSLHSALRQGLEEHPEDMRPEHERGTAALWPRPADLGDGAMLFQLHKLSKMPRRAPRSPHLQRLPLFNAMRQRPERHGDTCSKRWLDAIVAMPPTCSTTPASRLYWLIHNASPPPARQGAAPQRDRR